MKGCAMHNKWVRFFGVGGTLVGLPLLCVVGLVMLTNPWWFRPLPPTPPQARQVKTELLRDYASVADGTLRETHFTIDQSEAAIRAFYQTTLTTQGIPRHVVLDSGGSFVMAETHA